jgi:hypothetical protein
MPSRGSRPAAATRWRSSGLRRGGKALLRAQIVGRAKRSVPTSLYMSAAENCRHASLCLPYTSSICGVLARSEATKQSRFAVWPRMLRSARNEKPRVHAPTVATTWNAPIRFTYQTASSQTSAMSRRDPPELCRNDGPRNDGGRREGRVPTAPMVRVRKKARGRTTGDGRTTGLPCAMALRLIRDLPRDRLSCPCRRRDARASSPAWHQRRDARTTRLRRAHRIVRRRE